MKAQTKTKNITKRKTSRRSSSRSRAVVLIHAKRPVLRHFRLVNHKHTGKLIHFRHTSHLVLLIILLIVGFFLYIGGGVTYAQTTGGTVSVSVIVPGPAPTVGATITSPVDGTKLTDQNLIEVSGTCLKDTFVVVQDNGTLAGSTVCTDAGAFKLQIQLQSGKNVLSALNYDSLNQPGPATPLTTVYVTQTQTSEKKAVVQPVAPVLPANPSIIPGVASDLLNCDGYKVGNLPTGGDPHISVVCVPRLLQPKLENILGVLVWGGTPPYAITVDWGNGSEPTLLSLSNPGYKKETFSYAVSGTYKIALKLKDAAEKEAIVQTAVQVSGEPETPITSITDDILNTPWFKTPVPLYVMSVAITLGFWGGDIFNRRFGAGKHRRRTRKAA